MLIMSLDEIKKLIFSTKWFFSSFLHHLLIAKLSAWSYEAFEKKKIFADEILKEFEFN